MPITYVNTKIIIVPIHEIYHEIYKETIKSIRFNTNLITVSCVCSSPMFHVCGCIHVLFLLYLSTRVCVCLQKFKFKVHCGSAFEPVASGLPYYCTPPACIPDVIGALGVCCANEVRVFLANTRLSIAGVSIRSGAFGLSYYCTPLVCVPAVIGALVVCRHNTKKRSCCNWSASCVAA